MKKIGIIGAGNIGCALAKGLVDYKKMKPSDIYLSRKKIGLLSAQKKLGFTISDNATLVSECDILILAVLPGQAKDAVLEIKSLMREKGKTLVSVVSAVSIKELEEWSENGITVIRIMPNTAAEFGAGMTCIAGDQNDAVAMVQELFEPLGQTMVIKEHLMPAATIMAACGIAFFLRFVRAVSQGGIQIGFHADEAGKIAAQTARGAAELLLQTNNHPEN